MKYIVDTNVILNNPNIIERKDIVILSSVIRELEKHKSSHKPDLSYRARKTTRLINLYKDGLTFDLKDYTFNLNEEFDKQYFDNSIIQACHDNGYGIITDDILLRFKAEGFNIPVFFEEENNDDLFDYKGYKEIEMTNGDLKYTYENLDLNQWDLLDNEYLIVVDPITGEDIDGFRWDGDALHQVHPKGFNIQSFGKFKPKDFYQKSAIDSIFNNDLTMLKGKAGTGKSLIALNTAWHLIERGKFDQLIIFTNPVKTKNAEALGFYKGTRTEKLLDSQIGIMLSSKFGDTYTVESEISQGRLQLLPFSDIRGFDTSGEKKTIVWICEAQNTNSELMKLALQRIGENTKGIIDGDPQAQVDMDAYKYSNGMNRASEVFRGHGIYGEMELKHIYRSEIATIADKM